MTSTARRALRWLLLGVVVGVVVVGAWGSAVDAAPAAPETPAEDPDICPDDPQDEGDDCDEDPDGEHSLTVRCLKPIEAVLPGGEGAGTGERVAHEAAGVLIPPVGLVQRARQLNWMARYLGIGNWTPDFMRVTEEVTVRGPRWYVNEAKREADDHHNCSLARHTIVGNCTQLRARLAPEPPRYGRGGQEVPPNWRPPPDPDVPNRDGLTGLLPDKCWGRYPSTAYDIHYDDGGFFSWDRKIWAGMTGMIHTIGKAAIQIGLGLIGFAFGTFQVLDYRTIALTASDRYQNHLVGPFGLVEIAYVALFAMVATKALSGKLGVAGGEIVMSLVMATLASVLMANRPGYLEGAAETMDGVTSSVLAAGAGHNPSDDYDPQTAVRPVQEALFNEFVDAPFDYIHFGGRITEKTCLDRRDRILRANVPSDGGWAIRYMGGEEECVRYSRSMGEPTGQKMLTALLVTAVCIGVAIVVGGAALTMLVAKILLLVLFALAPFAAVGAILPGLGRRVAWSWVATLLQAFLAGAGMALTLSIFLLGIQGVTDQTQGLGAFERWIVLLVMVMIVFLMRARIVAGSQKVAGSFGDRMTRFSPAAAHWQGSGTTGGVDLATAGRRIGRGASATVGYGLAQAPLLGLAAVGGAVGMGAAAYGRKRTAKLGLRNLRTMELDKRMADGQAIPQWHGHRKAARLARAFAAKGGGKKGGGGPGGGRGLVALPFGRGGGPGGSPFVFNPRGPRLNFNTPGGPTLVHGGQPFGNRQPSVGGRMKTAMGNWMRPRMDGLAQKAHLDQAKHAMGRGWDRVEAGAKARWHSVEDKLGARWERREARLPNVYRPDFVANYGAQRQAIYQRYATRRSEVRAQARAAGRRVEPQQMRDLHASYKQELRAHKDVWKAQSKDRHRQARAARQTPPPAGPGGGLPPPPGGGGPGGGGPSQPGGGSGGGSPRPPRPPRGGGSGGAPASPPGDVRVWPPPSPGSRGGGSGGARPAAPAEGGGGGSGTPLSRYGHIEREWTSRGIPTVQRSTGRGPGAGRPPDDTTFGFNRPSAPSKGRTQPAGFNSPGSRGGRTDGVVEPKAHAGFGKGPVRRRDAPGGPQVSRAEAGFGNGPPRMRSEPRAAVEPKAQPGFGHGPPKPRERASEGPPVVGKGPRKFRTDKPVVEVPPFGPTVPTRREVPGRIYRRPWRPRRGTAAEPAVQPRGGQSPGAERTPSRVRPPRSEGSPSQPSKPSKRSKAAKTDGGSQTGSSGQPYWPPGSTPPEPPYPPPAAPGPKPPKSKPPKRTGRSAPERTGTPFLDPQSVPAPAYPPPAGKPPRQGSGGAPPAFPPPAGQPSGGGRGRKVKDPGYSVIPGNAVQHRLGEIDRSTDVQWGREHAGGDRYAYDRVTLPNGERITRPRGMQVTVTKDMLRNVPRTTSPPQALRETLPGFGYPYRLQLSHMWADRLGGPNAPRNFFAGHARTNGGGMAYVEGRVFDAVKQSGSVRLVCLPHFVGNEPIPREVLYAWKAPGDKRWTAVNIKNLP